MKMKKFLLTGLAVSIFAALGSPVFAEDTNTSGVISTPVVDAQTINLNNGLENLPANILVSDVLTFDELISKMAKDQGITEEEASSRIINNSAKNNRISTESALKQAKLATFRSLSTMLTGVNNYRPTLIFYCETSEGNGFHGIVKILETTFVRVSEGVSKTFNGTVFVNLENANTIYWIVNGDFYNNGTTTNGVTSTISLGGFFTFGFTSSGSTSWFCNLAEGNKLTWY